MGQAIAQVHGIYILALRPDGSILDVPGHDEASGLLYYCEHPNPPRVPVKPSVADALAALRFLWAPLALFPLVDAVANGVALHEALSLRKSIFRACRCLPTCSLLLG